MTTRWNVFYQKQMSDPTFKRFRGAGNRSSSTGSPDRAAAQESGKLSQTKLAALAEMSAPKISDLETSPRNVTISTLIRVAHALGSRVEIKFVPRRARKAA